MVVNIIVGICIIIMVLAAIYALVFLEGPDRSKTKDSEAKIEMAAEEITEQKIAQNTKKKHKKRKR